MRSGAERMKPDGETPEPTEAAAEQASPQENSTPPPRPGAAGAAGAPGAAGVAAAPEVNCRPVAEVKPKTVESRPHPTGRPVGTATSSPRPGTSQCNASRRPPGAKASTAGAVPKRPAAAAMVRSSRQPNQTSGGAARAVPAATNGSRPAAPDSAHGARPRATVPASRTTASTASSSTSTKAVAKASRPVAGPPALGSPAATSRPRPAGAKSSSTTSRPPAAGAKSSSTSSRPPPAGAKSSSSSSSTTSRPLQAGAKSATSRPPSAMAKSSSTTSRPSPAGAKSSSATSRPPPAMAKSSSTTSRPLPAGAKSSSTTSRPPPAGAKSSSTTSTASGGSSAPPAGRAAAAAKKGTGRPPSSARNAAPGKPEGPKPGATERLGSASKQSTTAKAAGSGVSQSKAQPVATTSADETGLAATSSKLRPLPPPAVGNVKCGKPTQNVAPYTAANNTEHPEATADLQTPTEAAAPEEIPAPGPALRLAPPKEQSGSSCSLQEEPPAGTPTSSAIAHPSACSASWLTPPPAEEEEEEEEREGSQLVSVSEMSGTTQPTEDSRPGSAGPLAGSARRAAGALLSELDSEEVSGSQQGASELSAPGVLEGTESTDDLGDGSLKGAMDIEGASAGSPDLEKVPDIPVNDLDEEEDEDDSDRVCDMDVGSERTDELSRPRHDNDEEDDDDDVEMASEGVTESGLESYGNADEDDFAEDERLDNLNRMAPPPPPLLPSAPAAQWDQPNPFNDPWAEPVQAAGAASPPADPWQLDSETPTGASARTVLELGSDPLVPGSRQVSHYSSVKDEVPHPSRPTPSGTLIPAPLSGPGTPEDLGHSGLEENPGFLVGKGDELEMEGAEPETLPAEEVFGVPSTAPASNPSSSSATEDEGSDTEGEAQLEDSADAPVICELTFDCQAPAQRCLSTVEEAEEGDMSLSATAAEDATPPSATSMASYGFDTSNSNAQSTGESCIRSPGIFSLEELPEEAKEPRAIAGPDAGPPEPEPQDAESAQEGPDQPSAPGAPQQQEEHPDQVRPPNYSAICEKTEDSLAGFSAPPPPEPRDPVQHLATPRVTPAQQQEAERRRRREEEELLSPSSGLCTIYEALENSEEEEAAVATTKRPKHRRKKAEAKAGSPLDLVQQLIHQTLLLNGDGCSPLLLLPGGAGGTLSPLESSLWPSLTPPSATVTSVSSFSPEAGGSSPQGDWTVVELETHH